MPDHSNLPENRASAPTPERRVGADVVHQAGLVSAALTVLGLDYAALDDLLTTVDPVYPELFFVIGSIPLLALIWRHYRRHANEE